MDQIGGFFSWIQSQAFFNDLAARGLIPIGKIIPLRQQRVVSDLHGEFPHGYSADHQHSMTRSARAHFTEMKQGEQKQRHYQHVTSHGKKGDFIRVHIQVVGTEWPVDMSNQAASNLCHCEMHTPSGRRRPVVPNFQHNGGEQNNRGTTRWPRIDGSKPGS